VALAQTRRDGFVAVVQLYEPLGGGWNLSDPAWLEPKEECFTFRQSLLQSRLHLVIVDLPAIGLAFLAPV
jgi:hypothetical protein